MELAGPMQKQQRMKPPHGCSQQMLTGVWAAVLYCAQHSRGSVFLYKATLLWLPLEITACLTLEGLTESRAGYLLTRCSIFLSAIQNSVNLPQEPHRKEDVPHTLELLSEMDWYFQKPSSCCSYVPSRTGIKAEKDVLFLPMLPLVLSSEADFTVTFDFTNTMQASLQRATNLAASCRWHGKSSPSSVVLL